MQAAQRADSSATLWNPLADLEGDIGVEDGDIDGDTRSFLIFTLAAQWFAVDVGQVREILDDQPITPLPKAPADVEGMIDVRGSGVAIVDLSQHLGMRAGGGDQPGRIIVFEAEGGSSAPVPIGVRTDSVRDVRDLADDLIEAAPQTLGGWDSSVIEGVTRIDDNIVVVVDLSAVLGRRNAGSPKGADTLFDFG